MTDRLSIIIPTLNEARHLPGLLDALANQTRLPEEVIVADAGSSDETCSLARAAGALVTSGGMPAAGRNAGASKASGELLLFLDADVLPPPSFLQAILGEFNLKGLSVATCLIEPLSERASDWLISDATNLYLQIVQNISPHAPGFCILVRKDIHQAVGGFDESVIMAEDHDYVQRAARLGAFGVITTARIPVSVRRLEKEGLVRLAIKYLYCELHALAGRPIRSMPFVYEFGAYTKTSTRRVVDLAWLRARLGRFENPLTSLSKRGRHALRSLGSLQLSAEAFEQRLHTLLPGELQTLRTYLILRRALLLMRVDSLHYSLKRLSSGRPLEGIRLLDFDWGRLFQNNTADTTEADKEKP